MWRKIHVVAVLVAVVLGLIGQGMVMPAMAAGAVSGDCQVMNGTCLGTTGSPHHAKPANLPCQPVCSATVVVLPRPSLMPLALRWSEQQFAPRLVGLPPGLSPVPDPFPPRSRALA